MTDKVIIREMELDDPPVIAKAFRAQGWTDKSRDQYERYLQEQAEGKRTVLIAEEKGQFSGYLTIVWKSDYLPFRDAKIPEIVDFNVLIVKQRKGIGTILMDKAESRVAERSDIAGIGVGMSPDYGAAQVLYAKRGYIPDGRGIQYNGKQLELGDKTTVDHGLNMYFTKKIKDEEA